MAGYQSLSAELKLAAPAPGFAIWFTGLPAAGKTTLARAVQQELSTRGIHTVILDSDELRQILTPQPTYRAKERSWFYRVTAYLAAWLARSGVNVLIAATANRRAYRDAARTQIARFAEVYVQCSPEACRQRDPKGLYERAQRGAITSLPGVDLAYEAPLHAEAIIDAETHPPAQAATLVIAQLAALFSQTEGAGVHPAHYTQA